MEVSLSFLSQYFSQFIAPDWCMPVLYIGLFLALLGCLIALGAMFGDTFIVVVGATFACVGLCCVSFSCMKLVGNITDDWTNNEPDKQQTIGKLREDVASECHLILEEGDAINIIKIYQSEYNKEQDFPETSSREVILYDATGTAVDAVYTMNAHTLKITKKQTSTGTDPSPSPTPSTELEKLEQQRAQATQ